MKKYTNWNIKKYHICISRLFKLACLSFFIIAIGCLIYEFIYEFCISKPRVPLAPFWEDYRTYKTGRTLPSPITSIDKVDLTNFTLVITACGRNVEKHLPGFQENVYAIGALFRSYRIYLGESDSDDGTLMFLQEWKKYDPDHVRVYSAGRQKRRHLFRTVRIANCRNALLEHARAEMPEFDYYLVLDVDATSSHTFNVKNFLSNFIYPRSSWAAMTASQTDLYYDIWALRTWPTLTYDFMDQARRRSYFPIAWGWAVAEIVYKHNKPIPRNHSLVEVQSAFGGAAIYAGEYVSKECVYSGWKDHGWWFGRSQCEHVSFNECVRRNAGDGKIFVNPQFQNK